MAYNGFQYVQAVQNFTPIVKKKEAKFLPNSAKPQLPDAAQSGSMFFYHCHKNDKNNIQALSLRSMIRLDVQETETCAGSMYIKMYRINLQVQFNHFVTYIPPLQMPKFQLQNINIISPPSPTGF